MQAAMDVDDGSIAQKGMEAGNELVDLFDGRKCSYSKELASAAIARIKETDLNLSQKLVDSEVLGAHSSTSGSLVGVIRHGLRPQEYLQEHNIPLLTGANDEGSFGVNVNSVSMFVWYDVADVIQDSAWYVNQSITLAVVNQWINNFREFVRQDIREFGLTGSIDETIIQNPRKAAAYTRLLSMQTFLGKPTKSSDEILITKLLEENFPVVYLLSGKNQTKEKIVTVSQSRGHEFAVRGGVDQNEIMILVPPEKVSQTQLHVKELGQDMYVGSYQSYIGLEQRLFDYLRKKSSA